MPFKVGDQVIHPRHGLGQVTSLAVKQFVEGEKRPFYEISFPGSTLWVPLNLSSSGIRKLTVKSEIANCRRLLKGPAAPLNNDPRLRQPELSHHLKEGTLSAHCEVVRDLTASGWRKPLSGAMATFLKMTQNVLCQEWAAVEGISLSEAASEVESLLEKGRQAHDKG
jgi:RNA polymerase-interacting CarD/CdnL/TRCF family regulator